MGDIRQSYSADTSGSRAIPDTTEIATEADYVFIPLDETVSKIKELVKRQGQFTFIRAAVAAGKTTVAEYITTKFPDEFVAVESGGDVEYVWCANLYRAAYGVEIDTDDVGVALSRSRGAAKKCFDENKTLVVDEAHNLFGTKLWGYITKSWKFNLKMLFFSAAGSGIVDGQPIYTSTNITKKYMWYPPMPEGSTLVGQLGEAEVFLEGPAVDFLMQICGMHRGIFMSALRWVKSQQEQEGESSAWDLRKCVTEVQSSFQDCDTAEIHQSNQRWEEGLRKYMKQSRAVRVNGKYSDLSKFPQEVLAVLFGGPTSSSNLSGKERDLTIAGFLLPERKNSEEEFVEYDWDTTTLYGMATPLMAQYYMGWFLRHGYERTWNNHIPQSGPDLIARVFPYMSFSAVVSNVIILKGQKQSPLSSSDLPYEDHYNDAIRQVLQKLGFAPGQPLENAGKTDVIANYRDDDQEQRTCAIETVMARRGLVSHAFFCLN